VRRVGSEHGGIGVASSALTHSIDVVALRSDSDMAQSGRSNSAKKKAADNLVLSFCSEFF
jgi:precorrin-6B methylase 2